MDKLKTLKDLHHETIDINKKHSEGIGCFITNAINVDLLKQEAIKWIKEFKKYSIDTETVVDMAPNFHYTHGMRCGAILILTQVFNITEEDLK